MGRLGHGKDRKSDEKIVTTKTIMVDLKLLFEGEKIGKYSPVNLFTIVGENARI